MTRGSLGKWVISSLAAAWRGKSRSNLAIEELKVRTMSSILEQQRNYVVWREDQTLSNFSRVPKENGYRILSTIMYFAFNRKWFNVLLNNFINVSILDTLQSYENVCYGAKFHEIKSLENFNFYFRFPMYKYYFAYLFFKYTF